MEFKKEEQQDTQEILTIKDFGSGVMKK